MAAHAATEVDPYRNLIAGDVSSTSSYVLLVMKWSKTLQNRNKVQILNFQSSSNLLYVLKNS